MLLKKLKILSVAVKPLKNLIIKQVMSKLDNIEKKNPFKVPDGYFEEMTTRLMDSVKEPVPEVKRSVYTLIRPHLTMAAAMIALVIVSYTGLRLVLPDQQGYPDFDQGELAEYLSMEVDEHYIVEHFGSGESSESSGEIPDSEIISYLLDNNIDYISIIENL